MINRVTGEITFNDGLCLSPQKVLSDSFLSPFGARSYTLIPSESFHQLYEHQADHGRFTVDVFTDEARRIQSVSLTHQLPSYNRDSGEDAERQAFHEGIVAIDLGGQHEFSWGHIVCRRVGKTSSLFIYYTPGPHVPLKSPDLLFHLRAQAKSGNETTRSE